MDEPKAGCFRMGTCQHGSRAGSPHHQSVSGGVCMPEGYRKKARLTPKKQPNTKCNTNMMNSEEE